MMTAKQGIVGGAAAVLLAAGIATYVILNRGELATIVEEESASAGAEEEGAPAADETPAVGTIDDMVLALQYRKEFLPSGFKLLDTHGNSSNPGFIPQEEVERFPAAIGVDAEVNRNYYCLLSRDGSNERCLSYHVVETANHAEAVAVAQAWRHDTRAASYHKSVIRNVVVLVVGYASAEAAAEELMNNLKNAVNYVD